MVSEKTVAIIGGGRWAREIAIVLNDLLSPDYIIKMHSPHNATGLRTWAQDIATDRIKIASQWPTYDSYDCPKAVIVANAARFHFTATIEALLAGVPTLVEKPLAVNTVEAKILVDIERKLGVTLCLGHVLLFTRYVQTFVDSIADCGSVKRIEFSWCDPAGEVRNGALKYFDPSISVIHDVFPHILSLLRVITDKPISFKDITLDHGGAKVNLDLFAGEIPCRALLERNAIRRLRLVHVETSAGLFTLDFTNEPGKIHSEHYEKIGDPQWGRSPSSLNAMLNSFLISVDAGVCKDHRLSPILGLEACRFTDVAVEAYYAALTTWLGAYLKDKMSDDIHYALTELLYGSMPNPAGMYANRTVLLKTNLEQE